VVSSSGNFLLHQDSAVYVVSPLVLAYNFFVDLEIVTKKKSLYLFVYFWPTITCIAHYLDVVRFRFLDFLTFSSFQEIVTKYEQKAPSSSFTFF